MQGGGEVKIFNATAVTPTKLGTGGQGNDSQYNVAIFPAVNNGATLTIDDAVFEGINIKNTHGSNVALVACVEGGGTLEITGDVTIKNSTIIGHRNVGSLLGNINTDGNGKGTVNISGDVILDNVKVYTVGGRSGMVMGNIWKDPTITGSVTINANCEFGIYKCEQNDNGAGLVDGNIASEYLKNPTDTAFTTANYPYNEDALWYSSADSAFDTSFTGVIDNR